MSLLLLFAYPNPASIPVSELVTTEPVASNGAVMQRDATSGEWRFVVELADPSEGSDALWRDVTDYYAGDRHQFGADDYMGDARARLVTVQLQIDDSDMLAPWGQDTSPLFGVDVLLDAGLLMRASMIRVVSGVVAEWEPLWTGRVESWGDASAARGQVRTHVVSVIDTLSDLANVPTNPGFSATWDTWFSDKLLPQAGWLFGVDIYGDTSSAGLLAPDDSAAAINRMDQGTDPLGLVWRTLRTGRMVIHPAPWDTTNVARYDNPLLDVYPDGLRFNYSPDFTDIEYVADDDQQPFGVTRNIAGVLNFFAVTMPADGGGTEIYAKDDPVSVARYGIRPFTATWILNNPPVVDDLLAARAFATSQALPLRVTLDHEGFWSAMAIVDHLDPVTVIHQTNDEGLVVTGTGWIRNVVEERTWRGDGLLSWQSTVQIDLRSTETSEPLLPVEMLAFLGSESSLLGTNSSAEFSWVNPVQPSITPTNVQYRILGSGGSLLWVETDYPGVGADGQLVTWLDPATAYTFQVRLIRRVDGVLTNFSAIREVRFTTAARIYPIPIPGEDPTDTDVSADPPDECDDFTVELQENDGSGWVTVDTFSGSELHDNGDGTFSLTYPIENSFFNDGSMYRFRQTCDGIEYINGPAFDPPDDWDAPCTTPPALSDPPFNDPSLIVYVPQICAPDTIREYVSGIAGVHGPALQEIIAFLGGGDARGLLAIAQPEWADTPGGILAYGECPQISGVTGDKSISIRTMVADAETCVLGECAAMRITCTPTGGGWRAGVTVYKTGATISLASAAVLTEGTEYTLLATHELATGTITLYVDGVLDNSVGGTDNEPTISALPIWRVGAPPESWVTDFAIWSEVMAPAFDPVTDIGWMHVYFAEGDRFAALGLADGASAASWPDEINTGGTDDLGQATSGNRPIYRASGTGLGLPCLDFDGNNHCFTAHTYTTPPTLPSSVVVLGYLDTTSTPPGQGRYAVDGAGGVRRMVGLDGGSGKWGHYAGAWATDSAAPSTGIFASRSKVVSGTSDVLTRNGSTVSTATAGDQVTDGITVGSDFTASSHFDGRLYLVGFYNGDITTDPLWADFVTWATSKGFTIS